MAELRKSSKARRGAGKEQDVREPNLPPWKAFVVQFSRESGQVAGEHSGRVEHLGSGERARFHSAKELLDFFEAILHKPSRE